MGTLQSCTCDACKYMCNRPCWGTPEDIFEIMAAGLSNRLMLDHWTAVPEHPSNVDVLCPANNGREGKEIGSFRQGPCIFQDVQGLCKLHDLGLKPTEGKLALHGAHYDGTPGVHEEMRDSWNTRDGAAVIELWREEIS